MAFFTRVKAGVPVLPASDDAEESRSESSTLKRGASLAAEEGEGVVVDEVVDEEEDVDDDDTNSEYLAQVEAAATAVSAPACKVLHPVDSSSPATRLESFKVDVDLEEERQVEGREVEERDREGERFDYVVDRVFGVEV